MEEKESLLITRRQAIVSIGAFSLGAMIFPQALMAEPVKNSLRFLVIGDWGIGSAGQINVANQMLQAHKRKAIDFVLTVGDNIYPTGKGRLLNPLFERPYAGLLQQQVKFYATLGNHDIIEGRYDQLSYPHFNMGSRNYYTLPQANGLAEFFMLDSNEFDAKQYGWLDGALKASNARWKIALFHHPLYSSASHHGSALGLRRVLEPLFAKYKVQAVFCGHDHTYERVKLQQGIQHFVAGGSGFVRVGDINLNSPFRQVSYDKANSFMLIELTDRQMNFQAVNEFGEIIDNGIVNVNGV